jgi:hypothetical protein
MVRACDVLLAVVHSSRTSCISSCSNASGYQSSSSTDNNSPAAARAKLPKIALLLLLLLLVSAIGKV